jgi:hypothetical protein
MFASLCNTLFGKKNTRARKATPRLGLETLEKRDLMACSIGVLDNTLYIYGTNLADQVSVYPSGSDVVINHRSGSEAITTTRVPASSIRKIYFLAGDSSDTFLNDTSIPSLVDGGGGNDTVWGGYGNDTVLGGAGTDYLYGWYGNDNLNGGANGDHLDGEAGDDFLISIDGTAENDNLYGNEGFDSFWIDRYSSWLSTDKDFIRDSTSTERATNVHEVERFSNGADRSLDGDNIADPTDGTFYQRYSGRPLFASVGPTENDIDQGGLGDCWLMAGIGALARTSQNAVRQTIVDFGDGTYGVHLNGRIYRVDADLPTDGFAAKNLVNAGLGQEGSLWVPLVEKAYAYFRTGANTYASLVGGFGVEALRGLRATGVGEKYFNTYASGQAILDDIAAKLSSGQALTLGFDAVAPGCPCISSHEYTVIRVNRDFFGRVISVVLRNPWATDGAGNDGSDDGLVTVTGTQLFSSAGSIAWGRVS